MERIAIFHPLLIEGGGSQARAVWTVEALKHRFDLYLITMGDVCIDRLNKWYGTHIKKEELKIISIPFPLFMRRRFDALRSSRLMRFCKKISSRFDVLISTYNVMDFGKKGIQFIADFSFHDPLRQAFDPNPKGIKSLFYNKSMFREAYLKTADLLAGASQEGWKKNITIVNSDWSGSILKNFFNIKTTTIYPPVSAEFPDISWKEKEDGFIYIGRLVPEKKVDKIIEILEHVRNKGWDIHLHILSRLDDPKYKKKIEKLCQKNRDWAFMEGPMFGPEKLKFIAKHKFGINGRLYEPFGISVAEMIKAGCIVWVPNGGGQVEIVNHPELLFGDSEDAATKIDRVFSNKRLLTSLRNHLKKQSEKFSKERFISEIKGIVLEFLKNNDKAFRSN